MIEAYPLQWPAGWPRTEYPEYSKFKNPTIASTRNMVLTELSRLGATDVVISSNLELNRAGLPSYRHRRINDTGVAVYFKMNGEERCIPSDKYITPEENLHAVGLTIAALRGLERWGTGQIMEAAFRGFKALPANVIVTPQMKRAWHEVLQVSPNADKDVIQAAYKRLAFKAHPDHGGSVEEFQQLQDAYKEAAQ